MDINYIAVLVASIVSFAFGAIWYSPLLFMSQWCHEAGIDQSKGVENPGKVYGLTFLSTILSSLAFAYILGSHAGLISGLVSGALIGLFIVMAAMGINYQFAKRSLKHWLIDGGFQVGRFIFMGVILGAWS